MPTIMVVEDNEPSRDALCRRLERRGYTVVSALDGEQAVAIPNHRDMALAAGGDDFDSKPVRFDQLLAKIETLLAKGAAS